MKLVRVFSAQVAETVVRDRIIKFLTQAGYKKQPDCDSYLHFKRGSIIGTISNFNPQQWACDVYVRVKSNENSSEINIEAKISSDPTEKHFAEELLTAEFSLLEAAITLNDFKTYDVSALKKKIAAHVYRIAGILSSFIISIILGMVVGLFASINLGIPMLGASAIGASVFLLMAAIFLVLWRKQKKTSF